MTKSNMWMIDEKEKLKTMVFLCIFSQRSKMAMVMAKIIFHLVLRIISARKECLNKLMGDEEVDVSLEDLVPDPFSDGRIGITEIS
ncbi:unnamed protein product, partial [Symbiodinium sp. KB8]